MKKHLQVVPGKFHCPECRREIYSRKRRTCEFCGARLPKELRLSKEQTAIVKAEIAEIHAHHEQEKAEQEKRRAVAVQANPGIIVAMSAIH